MRLYTLLNALIGKISSLKTTVSSLVTTVAGHTTSISTLNTEFANTPHIIESSSNVNPNNGWVWRKWSDGRIVCYGVFGGGSSQGTTTAGSGVTTYYCQNSYTFPSGLFSENPFVIATAKDNGSGVCTCEYDGGSKDACTVTVWGAQSAIGGNIRILALGC